MKFDVEYAPHFNKIALILPSEGWRADEVINYAIENGAIRYNDEGERCIIAKMSSDSEAKLYTFEQIRAREPKKSRRSQEMSV